MGMWEAVGRALAWPSGSQRSVLEGSTTTLSNIRPGDGFYESLVAALDGVGRGGLAGLPTITLDNAGSNSGIYIAMAMKGGTIASMPLQVFDRGANGSRRQIEPSDYRCLWGHPNAEETPQEFWETEYSRLDLAGDSFMYCDRNRLGQVVELFGIDSRRMQVGRDPRSMRKVYVLDGNYDEPMVTATQFEGEIIHVRNLTWGRKGLRGFGLIDLARLELQIDSAALEFGAEFFANGSTPGGVLTSEADIDDELAARLSERWQKAHGARGKRHKIAVLGSGGKFQQTTATPEEAQALPTRLAQLKVVARFTGVPLFLMMENTGSTTWGTGLEEIGDGFVRYTLARTAKRFEQALQRIQPDQQFARWNFNALLRGSTLRRMQAYQIGRITGLYSKDDLREMEDLPPIQDDERWKYGEPLTSNVASGSGPEIEKRPEEQLADITPEGAPVAQQALNGAQIASLVEVLLQVTAGEIAESVAKTLLKVAFPTIEPDVIDQMVDDAAAFEPERDPAAPPEDEPTIGA